MYKSSFALIIAFAIVANAGPNSNAELYINFGTDTAKVDSVSYHSVADTFTAAIQINKAVSLYAFEFLVGFDTSALQFISGSKELAAQKNMLETQNGALSSFICSYSRTDSTKISIGVSLSGMDTMVCPDGSGFLAFLKFLKKNNDTTTLTIQNPLLETIDEVTDTKIATFRGEIYPLSSPIIKHNSAKQKFTVQKAGEIVTIYSPEITPQSIQLFSIDGRSLAKVTGNTRKTTIALPSLLSKGPCVIRVQSSDNQYSTLFVNN
jgi:hypothetical protein